MLRQLPKLLLPPEQIADSVQTPPREGAILAQASIFGSVSAAFELPEVAGSQLEVASARGLGSARFGMMLGEPGKVISFVLVDTTEEDPRAFGPAPADGESPVSVTTYVGRGIVLRGARHPGLHDARRDFAERGIGDAPPPGLGRDRRG